MKPSAPHLRLKLGRVAHEVSGLEAAGRALAREERAHPHAHGLGLGRQLDRVEVNGLAGHGDA